MEYGSTEYTGYVSGGLFLITGTDGTLVAPFGTIVHRDVLSPREDGKDNNFSDMYLNDGHNDESFGQIGQEFRLLSDDGESLDYILGI